MPELPEVETVRRGLANLIIGKVVSGKCTTPKRGFRILLKTFDNS